MATSNFSEFFRRKDKGFTLFEVLIVISIIAILSGILVGYSRQNSRQLALATSQAKLVSLVSRAKFLSIQTYFQPAEGSLPLGKVICAYGVRVEDSRVFIFQDVDTTCSRNPSTYTYGGDDVDLSGDLNELDLTDSLVNIVEDDVLPEIRYIIFVPPEPLVKINEASITEGSIMLSDGDTVVGVSVTEDGQVSAR